MSDALLAELASLKADLAGDKHVVVESAFAQLVRVHIGITPVRCLTCAMHFPDDYPETGLGVELHAERLDADMVAKLQVGVEKEMTSNHAGKAQILPTIRWLEKFLTTNKLLPCYAEIKQLKQLLPDAATSLKLSEKAGRITIALSKGDYAVGLQLVVPDTYPAESPELTITHSNFTKDVTDMFATQAREMIRRMRDGFSCAAAMAEENDRLRPSEKIRAKMGEVRIDLSADGLHDLKADREFLNKYAQVRGSHEERKGRRQLVHKQSKEDQAKDSARAAREAAMQQKGGHEPRPSVYDVVNFLASSWVWKMPAEACPLCKEQILPKDPKAVPAGKLLLGDVITAKQIKNAATPEAPPELVRVYCGHWFHFNCLDPYMRAPPFNKCCPVETCARMIFHPLWTSNKSLLEKRWAYEESKKAEIEEVADFLGVEVNVSELQREIRAGKL